MNTLPFDSGTYYFGYGSNLDSADWEAFCARAGMSPDGLDPVGPAWLPDHELAFNYYSPSRGGGALNVRPRLGHVVPGVLFRLSDSAREALDAKEGAPTHYERFPVVALDTEGREVQAFTYRATAKRTRPEHVLPTEAYVAVVRRGYARFRLDASVLEAAARGEPAPFHAPALFAYGSLMRGESRFEALAEAAPLRCALLADAPGELYSLGDFPAMRLKGQRGRVRGEFFRVDDPALVLERLDRIEGFRGFGDPENFYRRTLIIAGVDGRPRPAWTYVLDDVPATMPRIDSGCWRTHRGRAKRFVHALVTAHAARNEDFVRALEREVTPPCVEVTPDPGLTLDEIVARVLAGEISERRIARVSGEWAMIPTVGRGV